MARNIITEEWYNKIKPHVGNPKDDSKNKKKYGIGQSVVRNIRNTNSFAEYEKRGATYRAHVKRGKTILDACDKAHGVPELDDKPLDSKDFFTGKSLLVEPDVNKRGKIVDILVIAAIIALLIIVLMFGGK